MTDGLREILETIARHRLRALATAFGVFWGIFMLTLLLAGGRGLRNGIDKLFAQEGVNAVWISTSRTTRAFEGLGAGRSVVMDVDDLDALERSIPELANVSPRQRLIANPTITQGTRSAVVPVFGVRTGYPQVERIQRLRGRLLNALDLERARRVVVIGQSATKLLFEDGEAVGHSISIGGADFEVVGEFSDPSGDIESLRMFIPFSTLASAFDASGRVDLITATAARREQQAGPRAHRALDRPAQALRSAR